MENIDSPIVEKLEEQKELGGVNLSQLELGTVIVASTKNSIYNIEVLGDGTVNVQGGKHFPLKTKVHFNGSTWGSSLLKLNWIGKGMQMEFLSNKLITSTSPVQKVKIIGNGWEYEMWD